MFDLERQAIERKTIRSEVLELYNSYPLFILQLPTGGGKGFICMDIISHSLSRRGWLVVVPELLQIENLKEDIKKHGFEHIYEKIEDIICYASFNKYKGRELNLWFNEAHKLSKLKEDIAKTIHYESIIADTATLPQAVESRLNSLGKFYKYTVSLKEGIERGILPEPSINIVYTELDNREKRNAVKFGAKTVYMTDFEYVKNIEKKIDYWVDKQDELYRAGKDAGWCSNKLNQLGGKRKSFIANSKTNKLKDLLLYLGDKRGIIYTGSLSQCNEVGKEAAIHSKKTPKHNKATLEAFNNYEVDKIYVLKIGREGLNLAGVNFALITQLSSGNDDGLEFIQTSGRSYRSDSPEVYILVAKNTKDESMLKKALKLVDNSYVKELKI